MVSIGGVTVTAIRFGRGDKEGVQNAFMHVVTINFIVGCLVTLIGCGLTGPVCKLLGATGNYFELAKDYVFWWVLFDVANSVSLNIQPFCRNDGTPGLVAITNIVITTLNILLDWLFVFPMGKGVLRIQKYKPQAKLYVKIVLRDFPEAIAQFSTPVTTFCMNKTLMATYGNIGINAFSVISYLSSFTMSVFFGALVISTYAAEMLNIGMMEGAEFSMLLSSFIKMVVVAAISGVAMIIGSYVCADLTSNVGADMRKALHEKSMTLSVADFRVFGTASVTTRTVSDIDALSRSAHLYRVARFFFPSRLVARSYLAWHFDVDFSFWRICDGFDLYYVQKVTKKARPHEPSAS